MLSAIKRVSEEETVRQQDDAYSNFCSQLDAQINEETLPLPEKHFEKICKELKKTTIRTLKGTLAEILPFEDVVEEMDRFEEKLDTII